MKAFSVPLGTTLMILMIISTIVHPVNAIADGETYQAEEISLHFSTTTTFTRYDYPFDPDAVTYTQNTLNHKQTIPRDLWVGCLKLSVGKAYDEIYLANRENFSGNFQVNFLHNPYDNLSMQLNLEHTTRTNQYITTTYTTLFDGKIKSQNITGEFEDTLDNSYYTLENGSVMPISTYNYLLMEDSMARYDVLALQFFLPVNQTWNKELVVSVSMNTIHNPKFFELMLDRINPAPSVKKDTTISRWFYLGLLLIIGVLVYVLRKRKLI